MTGLPVAARGSMLMGVGGLLKQASARIQSQEEKNTSHANAEPQFAVLVLAAGRSSRMGKQNKLLVRIDGKPMLEHLMATVSAAGLQNITVVTGYEAEQVQAALAKHEVMFTHNPDYTKGISSSLRCGLESLPENICAALVCLGDMPLVKPEHIRALIDAFDPLAGRAVCVPVYEGRRGNPVLWSSRFFNEMKKCAGDAGARRLLDEYAELVCEVPVDDPGVLLDFDTQQALAELNRKDD